MVWSHQSKSFSGRVEQSRTVMLHSAFLYSLDLTYFLYEWNDLRNTAPVKRAVWRRRTQCGIAREWLKAIIMPTTKIAPPKFGFDNFDDSLMHGESKIPRFRPWCFDAAATLSRLPQLALEALPFLYAENGLGCVWSETFGALAKWRNGGKQTDQNL